MPNPGKIGIGVLLVAPDGRREEKSFLLSCIGCNNEAELHGLCSRQALGLPPSLAPASRSRRRAR